MIKRVLITMLALSCITACGVKRDLKLPEKQQAEKNSEHH